MSAWTLCSNCQAPLSGSYCSACGQKAVALRPTLHDLTHEAVHEFVHVDGKVLQTLRLLITSPGRLTREFLEGRRVRYVTPLRLYLICSVLFFATVALIWTIYSAAVLSAMTAVILLTIWFAAG